MKKYLAALAATLLAGLGLGSCALSGHEDARAGDSDFAGIIGRTLDQSVPAWPSRPVPRSDAPNIVVWLLDDAGFAHLEPYGGLVRTPILTSLARNGALFRNFNAPPLCSPSRAALLSGRNSHSVGMGSHVMSIAGFPGYNGQVPPSTASITRILRDAGYATFAVGKWDQTPLSESSAAGPFNHWPSGQGFERFYGFLGGDAHHFSPSLWSDHSPVHPGDGDQDYFLTTDLADHAMEFIGALRANNSQRPFFLYFATGAVHAPHHAPEEYIRRYRGAFDEGWDVLRERVFQRQIDSGVVPQGTTLTPRSDEIPAWESLSDEQRTLYARQMEAFAGQLEHADHEFGRMLAYLERIGELDNTIIIVTSDNGASAEGGLAGMHNEGLTLNGRALSDAANARFLVEWGGPATVPHFHAGWAMVGNTPFAYYKHHTEGGGSRVPLILSWRRANFAAGVRPQYGHMIDIGPTLLEAGAISAPSTVDGVEQAPLHGQSLLYALLDPEAPSRRTRQYYEVWGNRAIYEDGWRASTIHANIMPWQPAVPGNVDLDVWRLFNVNEDFSESRDLSGLYPERLRRLQTLWEEEARRYGVFPIDPDRRPRFNAQMTTLGPSGPRVEYFPEGAIAIPEALAPQVKNRSFSIGADIHTDGRDSGVIVAAGGVTGGYALYLRDGYPTYVHNLYNEDHFYVRGDRRLPAGRVQLTFQFDKSDEGNGGVGTLLVNGVAIGSARIPETVRRNFSIEDGMDIGRDEGSTVTDEYDTPNAFTGQIERVVFDLR